MKSEIRNPKSETNPKSKATNPPGKVGHCCYCDHWGRLWGRWCKHPFQQKAGKCRWRWWVWVHGKNRVADPLPDTDWVALDLQAGEGQRGRKRKVHW